jgi:hypothetical protein
VTGYRPDDRSDVTSRIRIFLFAPYMHTYSGDNPASYPGCKISRPRSCSTLLSVAQIMNSMSSRFNSAHSFTFICSLTALSNSEYTMFNQWLIANNEFENYIQVDSKLF